jgi:DNA-binding NtrC family response regulator
LTILLVEDDKDNAAVFEYALKMEGFVVDVYNDPNMALSSFKPEIHHVAVIDYSMPGMTGTQLLDKIKKQSTDVKAIILTGYQGAEIPANKDLKVITKPVMPSRLGKIVKEFLNERFCEQ